MRFCISSGFFVFYTMAKEGFKNQWIAISRVGQFTDSANAGRDLNEDFLSKVVANFTPHDSPAVVGHPKDNTPAFGWTSALRLQDGVLEARFSDVDDEFESMVEAGKFRKRSASFYLNPPSLRHVGFLGAMPPAVKGLKDIQFADGESVTVEISFSEENFMSKENEIAQEETKTFKEWMKEIFGGGQVPAPANFSEAERNAVIAEAVKQATEKVTADFTEKLNAKDEKIQSLETRLDATASGSQRAEIISFVENIPAISGKIYLKNAGIVEFLEACAAADSANAGKELISFSEGEGDKRIEHKFTMIGWAKQLLSDLPPMIAFGEKFGDITATAEADVITSPGELESLRGGMGVKTAEGGAK